MYDKQWKIHNKFEKDECKWSEVDFYQEFLLCIYQHITTCMLQLCTHIIYRHIELEKASNARSRYKTSRERKKTTTTTSTLTAKWRTKTWRIKISRNNPNETYQTKNQMRHTVWDVSFRINDVFVHIALFLISNIHHCECKIQTNKQVSVCFSLCLFIFSVNIALVHAIVLMFSAKNQKHNQHTKPETKRAQRSLQWKPKKKPTCWTIFIEFERIPNEPSSLFDTEFQISRCIISRRNTSQISIFGFFFGWNQRDKKKLTYTLRNHKIAVAFFRSTSSVVQMCALCCHFAHKWIRFVRQTAYRE